MVKYHLYNARDMVLSLKINHVYLFCILGIIDLEEECLKEV